MDWGNGEQSGAFSMIDPPSGMHVIDFICFPEQTDQTTGLGSWASRGGQVQPQGLVRGGSIVLHVAAKWA